MKLDSNGKELWNKTYKYYLTGYDQMVWLTDIIPTSDTEYALIGMTETSTSWNVWLLKFDNNGEEIWNKTYDGPSQGRD